MDSNGMNNGMNSEFNNGMNNGAGSGMNNQYGNGGASEQQKAPNIFMQLVYSFVPPKYGSLTKVKTGSMIGFVTLFMLVITLISFVVLGMQYIAGGGVEEVLDELPDFELSNGCFYIDEDFLYDEGSTLVLLTEYEEVFTRDDVRELNDMGYRTVLLVTRDKLCMLNNGEYQEYYFAQLGDDLEINKQWIVDTLMPVIWVFAAIGFVFFFVFRTLWYFVCAAVYLLIAMLISLVLQKKASAGDLFRTAVYAKAPMFVVALVFTALPFVNSFVLGIIRTVITIVIMGFGVWSLPQKN